MCLYNILISSGSSYPIPSICLWLYSFFALLCFYQHYGIISGIVLIFVIVFLRTIYLSWKPRKQWTLQWVLSSSSLENNPCMIKLTAMKKRWNHLNFILKIFFRAAVCMLQASRVLVDNCERKKLTEFLLFFSFSVIQILAKYWNVYNDDLYPWYPMNEHLPPVNVW